MFVLFQDNNILDGDNDAAANNTNKYEGPE